MRYFSLTSRVAGETTAAYRSRAHDKKTDLEERHAGRKMEWRSMCIGMGLFLTINEEAEQLAAYISHAK
jgi:hypothetical protein